MLGDARGALVIAMEVCCSRGTFIRSLVRDIGAALGCGATLLALVRTAVVPFTLADAIGLEALRRGSLAELVDLVHAPEIVLSDVPACLVAAKHRDDSLHVRELRVEPGLPGLPGLHRFYDDAGVFLGVAERADGAWQKRRVMLAKA